MRASAIKIALLTLAFVLPAHPCAIIALVHGAVFVGNNEDYFRPGLVWFVPARNGRYGRVNVGFDTGFAQGSMNEAGLCFDSAALAEVPWKPDPNKKTPANLIERIMFDCATVAEAIDYLERFNCTHLANSQFLFADATGDAAVVAWLPGSGLDVRRIEGRHLIATNTRLGMSGYRCPRWMKADQILSANDGPESLRAALAAIHQEGPASTTYSTIYDLKRKTVRLYNLSNFDRFVEFNLLAELSKGRHSIEVDAVFDSDRTLDDLLAAPPRHYETRVDLPPDALQRFAGRYQPVGTNAIIDIRVDGSELVWTLGGGSPARLFPESPQIFRIAPDHGQVSFDIDAAGNVTGLTLHQGSDAHARRLFD